MNQVSESLARVQECFVALDIDGIRSAVRQALELGVAPIEVLRSMSEGIHAVGQKFEAHEFFLSELIVASEVMKAGLEILKPHLAAEPLEALGKVVIGTVKGDLHDLGKNIVASMLTSAGFEVHDLGIDVGADAFLEKASEVAADVVGMSALLTTTTPYISVVSNELKKHCKDRVKIIVGGAALNERLANELGADAYAKDVIIGVKICQNWVKERGRQ